MFYKNLKKKLKFLDMIGIYIWWWGNIKIEKNLEILQIWHRYK